jgi:hypothetical protein
MIRSKIAFAVERPIEFVFERISNISDYYRWVPQKSGFFLENEITSNVPFGIGTTYRDKLKWGGKATGEIITFDPPSKVGFKQTTYFGIKVFSAVAEYDLMSYRSSTEVVHRFEAAPLGVFKLVEPILSSVIQKERAKTCRAIKVGLEKDLQVPA